MFSLSSSPSTRSATDVVSPTTPSFSKALTSMRTLGLAAFALVTAVPSCNNCPDDDANSIVIVTSSGDEDKDGDGFTPDGGDCNDNNPDIHPGAIDAPYDGVNSDCDTGSDFDGDGDGVVSTLFQGGTDCNDADPNITSPDACDTLFNMSQQYGNIGPVTDTVYSREDLLYVGTGLEGQTTPNSICQLAGFDEAQFARGFGPWPICSGVDISLDVVDPDTLVAPGIENMHDCEGNHFGGEQGENFVSDINASYGTRFAPIDSEGNDYNPTSVISIAYNGQLSEGIDGVAKCAALRSVEEAEE